MNPERRTILWVIVGLFVLVTGLLVWREVYQGQTHFLAGTKPPEENDATALEPQLPPLRPSDPSFGSADEKVLTIVEFADFTCLYCRLTEIELQKALPEYANQIRFVWRDLPVANERPEGMVAAMAGRCAAEQGKFWEMHDEMFVATRLDIESLKVLAKNQTLDTRAFEQCLSSGRHLKAVQNDIAIAQSHAITSAPTLFIGGTALTGYASEAEIRAAIRSGLRKK